MKILHTADWHLGKKLYSYPRIDEQKTVLAEICQIAEEEQVDLVLIAGDVYDTLLPPLEAEELFYQTLKILTSKLDCLVIVIAGNHDAPDKITAASPLATTNQILLAGYPRIKFPYQTLGNFTVSHAEPGFVEIRSKHLPPIRIILSPYVNESRWGEVIEDNWVNRENWLQEELTKHWKQLAYHFCNEKGVNLLMAHLFLKSTDGVKYAETEDKQILRGHLLGMDSAAIPESIQYTALGHLHQMHAVKTGAWYSGSPIAYSFSEAEQEKFVLIVSVEPGQPAEIRPRKLSSTQMLRRKECFSIQQIEETLYQFPQDLFEITLTMQQEFLDERYLELKKHPRIIRLLRNFQSSNSILNHSLENLNQTEEELFTRFYQAQKNCEPSEEIIALFQEIKMRNTENEI
ncbi:MAG: exonuclease subunit SbcD [Bacteroidia bacterium]|nr:exonuclease subunit SbcD [Bacteroidia bacterium]